MAKVVLLVLGLFVLGALAGYAAALLRTRPRADAVLAPSTYGAPGAQPPSGYRS